MLQTVIDHLWQSTLIAAGIGLLCRYLRRDAARIRYGLWWAASLKFLIPFSALTALGARFAETAAVPPVVESFTHAAQSVAQPVIVSPSSATVSWVLLALWAAGSSVVLARSLIGALRLRALVRRARAAPEPIVDGRLRIDVYHADEPIEPGVFGLLAPVIVLPSGIDERLSAEELDAVIAHELCHVRRRDNLTAAAHMLVEAAFWFFPPVWWIGARLIDERERACDEQVVQLGHGRETYAESVLKVCEHYLASGIACSAGVSGGVLTRRITEIMRNRTMKKLGYLKKLCLAGAATAAVAAPVLVGLSLERPALAQQPPAPTPRAEEAPVPPRVIVKVAPVYPPRAVARGIPGTVTVEFTVTAAGKPSDIRIVDAAPTGIFDRPTIEAVAKWKFEPPVDAQGSSIELPGMTATIRYEISRAEDRGGAADAVAYARED